MRSKLYFAKGTLSKGLTQDIVTYGVLATSSSASIITGMALSLATGLGPSVAVLMGMRLTS